MEINRGIECLGTLEDRPEKFVIEIAAPNVTIDERPLETVITDRSLHFGGSGIGVRGRQCGKSAETSRMAAHGFPKDIIRFAREHSRLSGFELLCARGSKRQYLHIDVSGIHVRDPLVAKVAHQFKKFGGRTAEFQSLFFEFSPRTIEESRSRKMFFKSYRAHNRWIQLKNSFRALPPRMLARSLSEANASNSSKRAARSRYSSGVLPNVLQMMRSGPKLS